jgi:hypothetical protein
MKSNKLAKKNLPGSSGGSGRANDKMATPLPGEADVGLNKGTKTFIVYGAFNNNFHNHHHNMHKTNPKYSHDENKVSPLKR